MRSQYRVVREAGHLSVREVYGDGMFSADPCHPSGETLDELRVDVLRMRQAFKLPILQVDGDRLVQVSE